MRTRRAKVKPYVGRPVVWSLGRHPSAFQIVRWMREDGWLTKAAGKSGQWGVPVECGTMDNPGRYVVVESHITTR